MAKYTVELRKICDLYKRETVESWFKDYELSNYLTDYEINVINERGTWSKEKLASKIVDHYFIREIGSETPALFQHYAKVKMQEIMEQKLPLIFSASVKYDMLVNVDYTETYTRDINDTGESTSKTASSGLTVNSDTPQGQINKTDILQGEYASSVTAGENEGTDNTNTKTSSNEVSSKNVKGNSGVSATAQAMIKQYRQNIVAIDTQIIEELSVLFMGLY